MLNSWLNPHYLKKETSIYFQQQFRQNKPFPHLELINFFKEEKALQLLKALTGEKFFLKKADLFTFLQTNDLNVTRNKILIDFKNFLSSKEFVQYLSSLTETKLNQSIDIFGTVYGDTHHLLPHDDFLENRRIAYFLYLSNLKKKMEGDYYYIILLKADQLKLLKKLCLDLTPSL